LSAEEAATLVEAVPDGARLVLSGDEFALWSAGPGRAFADLLAGKACPRVTSRTLDPGPIGELISYVGAGELAAVDAPGKEVVVVPVQDPAEAALRTVQLVADSVPRAFGVPAGRTQVITLAHGGPVGTRALNTALKERLNPGPGRFGGFDPGDRVVLVTGPGHVLPATVAGAEEAGLRLELESADPAEPTAAGESGEPRGSGQPGGSAAPGGAPDRAAAVLVPREEVAASVRHGWALTGHQAAAMRWPAVVVVIPGDAGPLLTRSWVYTAFARGERHVSVVQGAGQELARAVAGAPARPRTTRLASVLRELVS
jgi:ATP-dependent exoDNAse (exonuclease V) alpha subunit